MPSSPDDFEKLGAFYLGREHAVDAAQPREDTVLYDSRDLTTHAMCVGMTGSGKTGLCVSLLEEAAIDGIPALVIDPKGDLANLMLTFPELRADDFLPWIDESEAERQGLSAAEHAAAEADRWRKGLAQWGQDGARIARLRAAADCSVYTPGSEAGRQLSILSSFAAPGPAIVGDSDLFQDQVDGAVTGLLGLLGVDADPLQSREHILLARIIDASWREGKDLDLGHLIQRVQNPPMQRVGVMELDAFFPAADRFALAMKLNNLLAAPGYASWMAGEPLDVQHLLYTPDGRPRVSILYIAHLSDRERMFVVTMLLNRMLAWMRSRSGTTSLRALLYMDEIFGYMPPVAEPPSKRPLLTLLKQARAFGLGIVLATQNPVDLDYKGLSNTGTWFLGRLQTERDKQRVLDGLEGASLGTREGFDRGAIERTLSGLGKRQFLLHNVHDAAPVVFQTRWAMSYLRGPLTRDQVARLTPDAGPPATPPPAAAATAPPAATPTATEVQPPVLPPDIPQAFLRPRAAADDSEITYLPRLFVAADIHFTDTRRGLRASESLMRLAALDQGTDHIDWDSATDVAIEPADRLAEAPRAAAFAELPGHAGKARNYVGWRRDFADWAYRNRRFELFHCPALKEYARPDEGEAEFRIRLAETAREERDRQVDKLRSAYGKRFATLRERIRKAEQAVEREREQAQGATMQTAISIGSTVLSALLGRSTLGRASTAARGAGYAMRQRQDVGRAQENLAQYGADLEAMESELVAAVAELRESLDPARLALETFELKPRRTDIDLHELTLTWAPFRSTTEDTLDPLI